MFGCASSFLLVWVSIPQGCPLSMMFIVALYLLGCRYLAFPQLYGDNFKCRDPGLLLRAARSTTWYVSLVGQELVPSVSCWARLKPYGVICGTGSCLRKEINGLVFHVVCACPSGFALLP